jgi:surface polysaccharide O-acyltransferase-like enzyme
MQKNYTIDYVRFLCAFGVILIHLSPSLPMAEQMTQYFSRIAVPFFLMASVYLFQVKGAKFDKIHFPRIVVPYIAWSIIYLICGKVKYLIDKKSVDYDWFAISALGGASVQLYFLPLLLCILVVASVVNNLFVGRDNKTKDYLLALIVIVGLIVASDLFKDYHHLGFDAGLFDKTLYYILFSQVLVVLTPHLLKQKNIVFPASITTILFLLFSGVEISVNNNFLSVILSALIVIVCLTLPTSSAPKSISNILSSTYGIYLCHMIFIQVIGFVLIKLSIDYHPFSILTKLVFASLVLIISVLFVLFIRRWKTLSFLLLGEVKSN